VDILSVVCRTDPDATPAKALSVIAVEGPSSGNVFERAINSIGHRVHLVAQLAKCCRAADNFKPVVFDQFHVAGNKGAVFFTVALVVWTAFIGGPSQRQTRFFATGL
jgi:hypothetical protein